LLSLLLLSLPLPLLLLLHPLTLVFKVAAAHAARQMLGRWLCVTAPGAVTAGHADVAEGIAAQQTGDHTILGA
jgi:hypothetical protein